MSDAKISVIVPVYNTEQYLPRCIESILGQSFADFELLLIDDGSADGSGAICDAYAEKDSRIRVFHKENGGVSSARNMGLDNAHGEWITFVDSDDYIDEDFFPTCFDENVELYVQNWRFANGDVSEWFEACNVGSDKCHRFMCDNLHTDTFRTASYFFFKRSILVKNGITFDTRFKLGEDTLFVMDYYKYVHAIVVLATSCYEYNRQDGWNKKYNLSMVEARAYLNAFMDKYDALHCNSPKLLAFIFNFIHARINKEYKADGLRWSLSKPVLRYKKAMLPFRGTKHLLKYYVAKTLSVFVSE